MPLSYTTVHLASPDGPLPVTVSSAEALALNYAPASLRERYGSLFAVEARFRRYVSASREPLLTQIKLAWWREEISRASSSAQDPEPLLGVLRSRWGGNLTILADYLGGYELLLAGKPMADADLDAFRTRAATVFASFAKAAGLEQFATAAGQAGSAWTTAWLLDEGYMLRRGADQTTWPFRTADGPPRLPSALRPVAVLHALGRRFLLNGGQLADGRANVLTAFRAGLLGR